MKDFPRISTVSVYDSGRESLHGRRNPANWSYNLSGQPELFAGRGFTGHEELPSFNLVNMNGRLYDPLVGRFLSPDNFIQAPGFTQSFNRYSYCVNNPLVYTDPSGEIFASVITFITDFIGTCFFRGGLDFSKGAKQARQNAWREFDPSASWSNTHMAWEVDKHYWGKLISNPIEFLWTMPQNTLGYIVATGNISFNNVESVDSKEGVFGLSTKSGHWERGYSLGSYIFGKDLIMDYRDHRYDHEYGHFLQSKKWGLFWSPAIGLPSLLSSWTSSSYNHKDRWFERNASKLGGLYFDEHYGTGAPGYVKYSKDYFSLEYFNKGGNVDLIPYYHPMHQGTSQSRYQTEKDRFHFTFLYHLIVLTPLLLFL